jgi:hypothetical protein
MQSSYTSTPYKASIKTNKQTNWTEHNPFKKIIFAHLVNKFPRLYVEPKVRTHVHKCLWKQTNKQVTETVAGN